jgi:hypothetical protein
MRSALDTKPCRAKSSFTVWSARFQYDLDNEGKVKTTADGTISVAWWLRDENGEWQRWMNNTFTKVAD